MIRLTRTLFQLSFLITALLIGTRVSAQDLPTITLDGGKMKFKDLVGQIESKSSYYFYYPNGIDTLAVTVSPGPQRIDGILQTIFNGTDLKYAIDAKNRVFITNKLAVTTSLPVDYFARSNVKTEPGASVINFADQLKNEKPALVIPEENRLVEIGNKSDSGKGRVVITGYVRDQASGQPLSSATVNAGTVSTTTNQVGYYSISLPRGANRIVVTSAGMKEVSRQIMVHSNGEMNIDLVDFIVTLKTVTVEASQRTSAVKNLDMGVEKLSIKTIKQVPVIFGQADVLRTILALPGVTSVGEASTGFNVRGGSADQNLILFDDATIYNPSHFFGFFSAFNPDAVKGIELYKSSIPEKYGGRIASVLDVSVKEGNNKKFSGSGGIGPLTSQLTLEVPLQKEKSSLLIGGRTTYSDWLLKAIPNDEFQDSKASFYDFNLHFTQQLDKNNFLYATGYLSHDKFRLGKDTTYEYGNKNANLKWKHNFKNNAFGVFTAGFDNYSYSINSNRNPVNAYDLTYTISQGYFRADFTKSIGNKHRINFGVNSIYYKLKPGSYTPKGDQSLVVPLTIQTEQGLESALYVGDEIKLTDRFSVNAGLRYSLYTSMGPGRVLEYQANQPREVANIKDTLNYSGGKFVKTYMGPEVRVSARYLLNDNTSVKASFNTLRQYIHMISNTAAIAPTDIWKLSDTHIKPQFGQQISLGFYHTLPKKEIELSVEVYYKVIKNYLDYKSGAQLLLNDHIETDVVASRGRAYGAEFMAKKSNGKLNGWISYTYARTELQTNDPLVVQAVNKGAYYPANFDRPHSVNIISNYRFSHRFSLSFNGIYSSGRPITLPIAIYNYGGGDRVYYSDRNQFRIPDYIRADISINVEGNHKITKLTHSSWSFGLYNVMARKNPYSVYFVSQDNAIKGYKLSIFGTAIPFITYNFKF